MGKKKSKLIIKDDDGKVILDTGISHSDLLKPYESKTTIHEFDKDGELYYPSQEEIINRWRKTKDEAELKKKYGKNWRDRFRKKKSGSIPNYLSKWGKEVVKYLLKNGETKNADIMDYLRTELKMDTSYDHLSAIFKTEKSREFYRKELIKDGSYFSLKDPNKFQ